MGGGNSSKSRHTWAGLAFYTPRWRAISWLGAGLALCLARPCGAQSTVYAAGPPITASFVSPTSGDKFADGSFSPNLIYVTVRFSDYDDVSYTSADNSRTFTNRERGADKNSITPHDTTFCSTD